MVKQVTALFFFLALAAPARGFQADVPEGPPPAGGDVMSAALLLTAPEGVKADVPGDRWVAFQPAVRSLVVAWEVADRSELRQYFVSHVALDSDLDHMRQRIKALERAPRVATHHNFDRHDLAAGIKFNLAFRDHLRERHLWEADRREEFRRVLEEADDLYQCYSSASTARQAYTSVYLRRLALLRLLDWLGPEAFANGDLPPNVPVWRFNEMK